MRLIALLLTFVLVIPSLALSKQKKEEMGGEIKSVETPNQVTAGDSASFKIETDKNTSKVVVSFPDINAIKALTPNKDHNKWSIKIQMNQPGTKNFEILAYNSKGKVDNTKKGQVLVIVKERPKSNPVPKQQTAAHKTDTVKSEASCSDRSLDKDGWCHPQCVEYVECKLGISNSGNAAQWWTKLPKGYSKNKNGSKTYPSKNDIMVWTELAKPYGHVAVVDSIDTKKMIIHVSDSNFSNSFKTDCQLRVHQLKYTNNKGQCYVEGVTGWLKKD
jgi:surface antigen